MKGEEIRLRTVGFLPKPLSVRIRVKHAGTEAVEIGGRRVEADRMEVKLDLHGLEKVVELVKGKAGAEVWLRRGRPPMILRIRYPLVEAGDPVVVLETLGSPRTPSRPERGARSSPEGVAPRGASGETPRTPQREVNPCRRSRSG